MNISTKSKLQVQSIFRVPYSLLEKRKLVWIDSDRLSGAALFYGTRVPLKIFLDFLEEDKTEEFLEAYPSVSKDQVIGLLSLLSTTGKRSSIRKPLKKA